MKVYLLLKNSDEEINLDNIILLSRKQDAEQLIKRGIGNYYETIEVFSSYDVDNIEKILNGVG